MSALNKCIGSIVFNKVIKQNIITGLCKINNINLTLLFRFKSIKHQRYQLILTNNSVDMMYLFIHKLNQVFLHINEVNFQLIFV